MRYENIEILKIFEKLHKSVKYLQCVSDPVKHINYTNNAFKYATKTHMNSPSNSQKSFQPIVEKKSPTKAIQINPKIINLKRNFTLANANSKIPYASSDSCSTTSSSRSNYKPSSKEKTKSLKDKHTSYNNLDNNHHQSMTPTRPVSKSNSVNESSRFTNEKNVQLVKIKLKQTPTHSHHHAQVIKNRAFFNEIFYI